jgi:hypothetical protein
MTFLRVRRRALAGAAAMTLLLPMSAAIAADQLDADRDNQKGGRPVTITFTKWRVNVPADPSQPPFQFEGRARGRVAGTFVAEVLQLQSTAFTKLRNPLTRIEAVYEVQTEACVATPEICGLHGDRSFTALIRGGQNAAASGRLNGVILAGWRTGASIRVEFERRRPATPSEFACTDAPINTVCFEGILEIGSAPGN